MRANPRTARTLAVSTHPWCGSQASAASRRPQSPSHSKPGVGTSARQALGRSSKERRQPHSERNTQGPSSSRGAPPPRSGTEAGRG